MNSIMLAQVSGETVVRAVLWLVIFGLIFYALHWLIGHLGIQEPFAKFARAILAIGAVIIVINILMSLMGKPLFPLW